MDNVAPERNRSRLSATLVIVKSIAGIVNEGQLSALHAQKEPFLIGTD
jgi:hypothetical protein